MPTFEEQPLLGATSNESGSAGFPSAPSINDSPPPAYHDIAAEMKTCDVCGFRIDISRNRFDYVVTCQRCNESTAIGNPPRGKQFARCSCHKLLIFSSAATKARCTRVGCGLVVDAKKSPQVMQKRSWDHGESSRSNEQQTPSYRFICGHCHSVSVLDTAPGSNFQCRHCRKRSSVGRSNAKAILSIVIGLAFVIGVLLLMVSGCYIVPHATQALSQCLDRKPCLLPVR